MWQYLSYSFLVIAAVLYVLPSIKLFQVYRKTSVIDYLFLQISFIGATINLVIQALIDTNANLDPTGTAFLLIKIGKISFLTVYFFIAIVTLRSIQLQKRRIMVLILASFFLFMIGWTVFIPINPYKIFSYSLIQEIYRLVVGIIVISIWSTIQPYYRLDSLKNSTSIWKIFGVVVIIQAVSLIIIELLLLNEIISIGSISVNLLIDVIVIPASIVIAILSFNIAFFYSESLLITQTQIQRLNTLYNLSDKLESKKPDIELGSFMDYLKEVSENTND